MTLIEPNPADELQPTFIIESNAAGSLTNNSSIDVSQPHVGFVEGNRPRFADETAGLLRSRLKAVSFVLVVILGVAFIGNLFVENVPLAGLRAIIVLVFIGSFFVLRSEIQLSIRHLRLFEIAVFGAIASQLLLMMWARISGFAIQDDAASAIAAQHMYLAAWCILILTYSIFMPNTWKRAALVLVPAACLPYLVLFLLGQQVEEAATAFAADKMRSPVPLPFVAVLVAVFGTHIINTIRREAFKARQFGQYRLKEKLGTGGMGEVYKAEHQLLKRPCAIKLIKPDNETDATALARFEREVQATSKLSHWNTVEIYDYGHTDDGTFYYVMELLPGMSLEDLVRKHGPLSPERAIHFLSQTCNALHEAHAMVLVHRDLKPANIFAAKRGGVCDVAKLLDFGLVKQQSKGTSEDSQLTQKGGFSGSPLYMSPEQATAYSDVDGRSDIYSLGAVAYYLLTGKPPFSGRNPVEVIIAHSRDEVIPPTQLNPDIPTDLESIILRCLEKQPADRFLDVESLRQSLEECECAGDWTNEMAAEWWKSNCEDQEASDLS